MLEIIFDVTKRMLCEFGAFHYLDEDISRLEDGARCKLTTQLVSTTSANDLFNTKHVSGIQSKNKDINYNFNMCVVSCRMS